LIYAYEYDKGYRIIDKGGQKKSPPPIEDDGDRES